MRVSRIGFRMERAPSPWESLRVVIHNMSRGGRGEYGSEGNIVQSYFPLDSK